MIPQERFPNSFMESLYKVTMMFIRPVMLFLDTTLLYFYPVSTERKQPLIHQLKGCIFVPIYGILLILASIIALPWAPIWLYLQGFRKPYQVSVSHTKKTLEEITLKNEYSICTANLCMISEFIARLSNIKDMAKRVHEIGKQISISQSRINGNTKHSANKRAGGDCDFEKGVATSFPPNIDFLCLQEVCDVSIESGKHLSKYLHSCGYHYVLYDIGVNEWKLNHYLLSSWLAFASKYPILDVGYHPYTYKCRGQSQASVGLLLVKVYLGKRADGKSLVGIIANTHLQSYVEEDKTDIPIYQLDSILKWEEEFREKSVTQDEVVHFNFLCGDFNFDNMSPGEVGCWQHRLFDVYHDVCREKPGKDYDWTVGTEMRLLGVDDNEVSTPEKLKDVLQDKYKRAKYFLDGNLDKMMTEEISWAPGPEREEFERDNRQLLDVEGRRRIDYVVFQKKYPVVVKKFLFVTQLAGLTDHIPVCMTFSPESK
ncbi:sphingomyelin phosphodiesterase 3-like [Glandiceps talaboti]